MSAQCKIRYINRFQGVKMDLSVNTFLHIQRRLPGGHGRVRSRAECAMLYKPKCALWRRVCPLHSANTRLFISFVFLRYLHFYISHSRELCGNNCLFADYSCGRQKTNRDRAAAKENARSCFSFYSPPCLASTSFHRSDYSSVFQAGLMMIYYCSSIKRVSVENSERMLSVVGFIYNCFELHLG